jgi:hypothetical protein
VVSFVFLPLFRVEIHVCLSRGVQVASAAWRVATMIMIRVGYLVQRIGNGRTSQVFGGRAIEMSDDTVCDLHSARGDDERRFFG